MIENGPLFTSDAYGVLRTLTLAFPGAPMTAFWPVTVTGWVTLVTAILALGGTILSWIWGWAKLMAKLNGLGGRVSAVEEEQARARGREESLSKLVSDFGHVLERVSEKLGEAKKATEGCNERTEAFAIQIGSKIDDFLRESREDRRALGERLTAVETELRLTRQQRGGT
jgi:hypothetical protein